MEIEGKKKIGNQTMPFYLTSAGAFVRRAFWPVSVTKPASWFQGLKFTLTSLVCLLLIGCSGPVLFLPGGALTGDVHADPVEDWSFVSANRMHLETYDDEPYSVEINYLVKDGALYIAPSEDRKWYANLKKNPEIRIRFEDTIYPVRAVQVGAPGELVGYGADPSEYVYRLDSRPVGTK